MRKRMTFFKIFILAGFWAIATCSENTLFQLKNYKANRAPLIESFTSDPAGIELSPNMQFQLTVKATDPDGNAIVYSYTAEIGSFTGQKEADGQSIVTYVLPNSMPQGYKGSVTVEVKDSKNTSVSQALDLGTAKTGPTLTQQNVPSMLVSNTGDITITWASDSNGFYQELVIRCDQDGDKVCDAEDPVCAIDINGDFKFYTTPNTITSTILNASLYEGENRICLIAVDALQQSSIISLIATKDLTPPTLTNTNPVSSSYIGNTTPIVFTFSESMDTASLALGGPLGGESNGGVWSTTTTENDTLTVSPAGTWSDGASRDLTITALKDLAGFDLVGLPITRTYSIDTTVPTVNSTLPSGGSTIGPSDSIVIVFSETMNTSSLSLGGTMNSEAATGWGITTSTNDTLTISPSSTWSLATGRTLTVNATDTAGLAVAQINLSYDVVDSLPTLLSSIPTDTAMGITPCSGTPCTGKIILVFSESMNTGLGQTLTTEIYNGSAYVAAPSTGTVFTWSTTTFTSDTLTVNFSGSWYWFPRNSQIRYTLDATGIKDVTNNQIAANVQQSFTTTTTNQGFAIADTGQTLCYNNTTSPQGCGDTVNFPRQDGDYVNTPNARNFTGPTQHATYNNDYTTTDNVTTLIWKSCTEGQTGNNCQGTGGAGDNYGADSVNPTWYNALNQCTALNTMNAGAGYAGRTKWRLPTIAELKTIPNYNSTSPAIDVASFPATANIYWSSSTYGSSIPNAWTIQFAQGYEGGGLKYRTYYVRCVTTGPVLVKSYTDNGDNTVTDTTTNLRWQKCSMGQTADSACNGTATTATWQAALQYCNGLALASMTWRLPSINELKSLVDDSVVSPSIKTTNFPATVAFNYWSSSTFAGSSGLAWFIGFSSGGSYRNSKISNNYYVRCVTTGP